MAKWTEKRVVNLGRLSFLFLLSYEEERKIQTASMDTSRFSGNDIVVPISLSTTFKIGDTMEMKIGDNQYEFKVVGFNEDYIYSSPMNMGTYLVYVSEKCIDQIEFEIPVLQPRNIIKMQIKDKAVKSRNVSDEAEADAFSGND